MEKQTRVVATKRRSILSGRSLTDIAPWLRSHHQRDRRGHDRLVRLRHALLRHTERTSRIAEQERRQKTGSSPTKSPPTPPIWPKAIPARNTGDNAISKSAFRISLGRSISISRLDPETAREFSPTRRLPQEGAKTAHFCLDVRDLTFCSMKITEDVSQIRC